MFSKVLVYVQRGVLPESEESATWQTDTGPNSDGDDCDSDDECEYLSDIGGDSSVASQDDASSVASQEGIRRPLSSQNRATVNSAVLRSFQYPHHLLNHATFRNCTVLM